MFSGRKKSLIDIIISCQADSPASVIRFEHNAGLWLEHCFQLKSGCDLPGQGRYPDWQVYKRRRHMWWVERLGEPTWGVREWLRDQDVRTYPFVLLPPVGWKDAGGIPWSWGHPMMLGHSMGSCFSSAERIYSKARQIKQFLLQGAWPEQRRRRNSHRKSCPQAQSFSRTVRYLTRNMMMFLFGKTESAGYLLQTRLFPSCNSQNVSIHVLYVAISKILVCRRNSKASL